MSVHADRRIIPLYGIIIHLDGVDYCIIIQSGPFHSLRRIMYNCSRFFCFTWYNYLTIYFLNIMKRKLLLFVVLLTGLTSTWAVDNGTLTVDNIRNAVPGYRGSFDLVLDTENLYAGYQVDITLPAGLSYDGYSHGPLIDGHAAMVTGTAPVIFTVKASPTANFKAKTGTLLTVYFTVASDATGTLSGGKLSRIHFSDANAVDYEMANVDFSVPVGNTITLSEDETEAPAAISGVDVTVNRTLKGGMWNTLVLPFDISSGQIADVFGAGTEVASFSGADVTRTDGKTTGIKVNFTSLVGDMKAHTPYIIKVPSDLAQFTVESAAITTSSDPSINKGDEEEYFKFVGTYTTNTDIPDGGLYLMNNKFKYSQGTSKLKAFRGYFNFWRKLSGYKTASAPAITLDVDGISTGINALELDADKTADSYYTVQGLQVSQPTKGLYIVNGRKIIIK